MIRWWMPVVVFLVVIATQAVFVALNVQPHYLGVDITSYWKIIDKLIIFLVVCAAIYFGKHSFKRTLYLSAPRWPFLILIPILCLSVGVVEDGLFSTIKAMAASDEVTMLVARKKVDAEILTIWALSGFLLTPITEEMLFRGYIFNAYEKRSVIMAILVSALLFQLFHTGGVHFFFGVATAYGVLLSRSLLPSIVGHSLMNLSVTLVQTFEIDWPLIPVIIVSVVVTILCVVGLEIFRRKVALGGTKNNP